MKGKIITFCVLILFISCSTDQDEGQVQEVLEVNNLSADLLGEEVVIDNVIACAASNEDGETVSIYVYPREGVTDINYYETATAAVDKNDFTLYTKIESELIDVFNGFLLRFETDVPDEKWVIVSFRDQDAIHISNPIRLKQNTKPTEYLSQNLAIDSSTTMPIFTWQDGVFDDTAIYFEAVTNSNNDILSATYTFDRFFQYYKLDNVVLNITETEPPQLTNEEEYEFTLLAVSEDNWVNLFSNLNFNLE